MMQQLTVLEDKIREEIDVSFPIFSLKIMQDTNELLRTYKGEIDMELRNGAME